MLGCDRNDKGQTYSFNIPCFQLIPKERPPVKARINYWKPETYGHSIYLQENRVQLL